MQSSIWVGLNVLVVPAIEKHTGAFSDLPRNMALLPPIVIKEAVKVAKLTEAGEERLLTPVEAAQIGLVWRITRRKVSENWASWADIDPFEDTGGAATPPRKVEETPTSNVKKLKMAHVLDKGDESEFTVADAGHINKWFHNFVAIMHGQPDEEETPTNEQLSALNVRVAVQLGSPFADFAVFTPYARKTSRAHRFTAYLPQPDGSWLAKEIPGPSNFQAWLYCWRVFRVACLMLKVAHVMPLDRYQQKIEKLAMQWPTARHPVCPAEDKCRFERFNRLKSRIEFDIALGRPAPPLWDGRFPWSAIFLKAAEDDESYWDDNIRHLAMSWLAHGSRGAPKHASIRLRRPRSPAVRVGFSGSRVHMGPRHFKQSESAPEQEGTVSSTTKRGEERSRNSAGKETKRQGRRQGRKEQSTPPCRPSRDAIVSQLEFGWWDVWRARGRKLVPGGQSSQMYDVPVRQAPGKTVSTVLTRQGEGRDQDSRAGVQSRWRNFTAGDRKQDSCSSLSSCAGRRILDVSALLFGTSKVRTGQAAALRGVKVKIIKRDIRLDGIDLLADEPFTTDLLAASDGRFDGFHSGFPCSTFSCARFLSGGLPPVRDRQHMRGRPSNSRAQQLEAEKETLLAMRSAVMVRAPVWGEEAGTAWHCDTRESSGSSCRPVPECLVVAGVSRHRHGTRHHVCNSQHLLFWSSSFAGAALDRISPGLETLEKKCCCRVPHVPLTNTTG